MLMKEFYTQIASTPELLKIGFQVINEKLQSEDCRQQTLQIILEGSYEFTLVLVQNVYPEVWVNLSEAEKRKTRMTLMQAVAVNSHNRKYIQSLAIFVSKLHNVEGYQFWVNLYAELIQKCKPQIVIEYFLVLFRESDNRISVISEYLLPYLYSMFRSLDEKVSAHQLQKAMILVYHTIKSFSCNEDSDPNLIERCFSSSFEGWVVIFINVMQNPNISQLQKYVVKILTNMFADMPKYSAKCLSSIIYPVWMLFNRVIVLYLTQNVLKAATTELSGVTIQDKYIRQIRFEENTLSEGLVYQMVELINTLFCNPAFETLNRIGLYLIINSFFNLLLISRADEKEWLEDPNKFIADIDDESSLGLRNRVSSCMRDLVERWPESEPIIRVIIENSLSNGSQLQLRQVFENTIRTSNTLPKILSSNKIFGITMEQLAGLLDSCFVSDELCQPWRRKQASILLLFYNADEFFENKAINKKQVLETLSGCITTKEHPLLQIQAMRTLIKCSSSLPAEAYFDLLRYSVDFLTSQYAGMRIMAVRSIGAFCLRIRNNKFGDTVVFTEGQIAAIISTAHALNGETLHIFLETCVELAKINQPTNAILTVQLQPIAIGLIQTYFQEGMLFSLLLELFSQLTIIPLQQHMVKFLAQNHTSQQQSELVSLYLQLLQKYIINQTWVNSFIPQDLLALVKVLLGNEQASGVVREYLKYGVIDQQLSKMLEVKCSSDRVVPLRKRGVNVNIATHLDSCINKILQTTSQYQVERALVLPMELLYSSTSETCEYLRSKNLYEPFVAKWLKYQPLFQGQMLRRVTILTLLRLNDANLTQMIKQYLLSIRKELETGDLNWQDDIEDAIQNMRIDDDDWLDRRMINEEVENQLKTDLPDVAAVDLEKVIDGFIGSS